MPSTIPKPKDQRRNRNPKQAGDWILLPEGGRKGPERETCAAANASDLYPQIQSSPLPVSTLSNLRPVASCAET